MSDIHARLGERGPRRPEPPEPHGNHRPFVRPGNHVPSVRPGGRVLDLTVPGARRAGAAEVER